MKRSILILLAAVLAVLAAGCGAAESSDVPFQEEPGAVEPLTAGNAEELLEKMSTEQKVGQLFLVRPEALDLTLTRRPDRGHRPGAHHPGRLPRGRLSLLWQELHRR